MALKRTSVRPHGSVSHSRARRMTAAQTVRSVEPAATALDVGDRNARRVLHALENKTMAPVLGKRKVARVACDAGTLNKRSRSTEEGSGFPATTVAGPRRSLRAKRPCTRRGAPKSACSIDAGALVKTATDADVRYAPRYTVVHTAKDHFKKVLLVRYMAECAAR